LSIINSYSLIAVILNKRRSSLAGKDWTAVTYQSRGITSQFKVLIFDALTCMTKIHRIIPDNLRKTVKIRPL